MKKLTRTKQLIVSLAVAGICFPQAAMAATPDPTTITDVRMHENGILYGQVLTSENTAIPNVDVALRSGGQDFATVKSDKAGRFSFGGLRNGIYRLRTVLGERTYRVWTAEAAPPAAAPQALLVADTVRGQQCHPSRMRTFRNLMANPLVIAGIVAAAVAIPVAIHNSRKPASP